ncbi:beta strand repeat-containing protein [Aeoliella mucimassa]|uniref:Uncharacterized protein n=1 Tax=Aeoliella mucimassa TaxID=2527972 RepID=A0A518APD3_9BACT|nr:hypothetical protein [Aeoliella mucimassa]QDU56587.1 hypothetical protein Pan181_27970 [Aeoliella mucimassa]
MTTAARNVPSQWALQSLLTFTWASFCALLAVLYATTVSANTVSWNNGTGSFTGSPNWSYNSAGTLTTTDNPFNLVGAAGGSGGENILLIGNEGDVTLNVANQGPFSDNSLYELRIGTLAGEADLSALDGGANYQGNGTLTVNNVGLILFNDGVGSGNLIIGGADGISGTMNWNSSETLLANGQLRVGQNGVGVFHQNGGSVQVATTSLATPATRIGTGVGTGTYNLNDGSLQIGSADDGTGLEAVATLDIGYGSNATGTLNLGDSVGSSGSASLSTWGDVVIGGSNGLLNIASDGELLVNYASGRANSARILIGNGGGDTGAILQDGGTLHSDGLMRLGFNTGTASYTLNGSAGSVNVRAFEAYQNVDINFNLDAGGATPIVVDGNTSTAGDTAAGNSVTLSNPTLNITGLTSYSSLSDILLFEQADASASLSGSFSNLIQGQVVGQNSGGSSFYLNLYGGDGNDIVLQSTLPSSSTDGLVWNTSAANFDSGWASGNGSFGVASFPVDPFANLPNLYLGNSGTATFDDTTNTNSGTTVQNMFIGTNQAAAIIAGRNGNGTLTVNGSQDLTIDDSAANGATGFFTVGEQGFTGTVNWNSTGTLDAQGKFRVGRDGGTGVFNQSNGIVLGGTTGGGGKYLAIGDSPGSVGTYNLNGGALYPDGQGGGATLRQFRVGYSQATGTLKVGDGLGAASSALFESEDDLWIGGNNGNGTLIIESDGEVHLVGNNAPLFIGYLGGEPGAQGLGVQNGGTLITEAVFSIGQGEGSVGEYQLNGGSVLAANDGGGDVRIGGGGGNGTLRVSGTASFSTLGNLFIAEAGGQGTVGLLELTGSQASFTVNRFENAPGTGGPGNGNDETIRWVADNNGITPIVIAATSGTNVLQLQDPVEVTANTGTNGSGDLTGDGIALELDLSALTGDHTLTLMDNQSEEEVIGFFELGDTLDLYEEGEAILDTGFNGTVTISYLGGTGNDVILSLIANSALFGDYNDDGMVDLADYTVWRDNLGASLTLPGEDPSQTPGQVTMEDYNVWKSNFGQSLSASVSSHNVPEPSSVALVAFSLFVVVGLTSKSRKADRAA